MFSFVNLLSEPLDSLLQKEILQIRIVSLPENVRVTKRNNIASGQVFSRTEFVRSNRQYLYDLIIKEDKIRKKER